MILQLRVCCMPVQLLCEETCEAAQHAAPCLPTYIHVSCLNPASKQASESFLPSTETLNWKNVVLVLGRRLPPDNTQGGECAGSLLSTLGEHAVFVCCVSLKCARVSALRRGVGADGVEQHPADGDQRPEETLREKRAGRS